MRSYDNRKSGTVRAPRTDDFRERQRYEEQVRDSTTNSLTGADIDALTWAFQDSGNPRLDIGPFDLSDVQLQVEMLKSETQKLEDAVRKLHDVELAMSGMQHPQGQKLEDLVRKVHDDAILREMMNY